MRVLHLVLQLVDRDRVRQLVRDAPGAGKGRTKQCLKKGERPRRNRETAPRAIAKSTNGAAPLFLSIVSSSLCQRRERVARRLHKLVEALRPVGHAVDPGPADSVLRVIAEDVHIFQKIGPLVVHGLAYLKQCRHVVDRPVRVLHLVLQLVDLQKYAAVVFFDTETTGLDAKTCQIIELAAIRSEQTDRGTLRMAANLDEFIRLPEGEKLPEQITKLTGITDEMLEKQGLDEADVAHDFEALLDDTDGPVLLVAHNAQFDLLFTREMLWKHAGNGEELFEAADLGLKQLVGQFTLASK